MEEKTKYLHLRDLGCCKTCCLRFLGEWKIDSFSNPNAALKRRQLEDGGNNSPDIKLQKHNACVACLGLLDETEQKQMVQKIALEVESADYDCSEFTCALSMPVSFSLRDFSLRHHLAEQFSNEFFESKVMDNQFISVKDVWKGVVAPVIAKKIGKSFNASSDCDFSIGVNIGFENDDAECACLLQMQEDVKKKKKILSRKSVDSMLLSISYDNFKNFYPSPPNIPDMPASCSSITLKHNSIFVAGRYNKFSRTLSQTPWIIDGQRHMENSVQELICDSIVEATRSEDMRFSSSGREDVDVRMLGRGRPFVCELLNPHRIKLTEKEFRSIERKINNGTKDVAVRDLQFVSKDEISSIKQGEENKTKIYRAYCVICGPAGVVNWNKLNKLSAMCPITLQQQTPIRVLHRRSVATRERTLKWIKIDKAETTESRAFVLRVATQAGTYVKEFVHGDFGRTSPNLRDLIEAEVDILALDVEDIELDWPAPVKYEEENEEL